MARKKVDPIHSPLFDSSATSMSGNGAYYNHTGVPVPGAPPPYDIIPPAGGGDCVTSGPFKKYFLVPFQFFMQMKVY
jgi:tyrosinase